MASYAIVSKCWKFTVRRRARTHRCIVLVGANIGSLLGEGPEHTDVSKCCVGANIGSLLLGEGPEHTDVSKCCVQTLEVYC